MSRQFSTAELRAAIGNLRQGKSPGHDNIHPEFVTHQSETTSAWLCSFFSSCFQRSKLPKTWRRAAVIALLKPGKTAEDPKAYRPISLLCVPFKILERMILSRIEPVVDPQLPREQAGFRRGRSTVDQVTLLTQDIEDSFQAKEKVGVVLLDLTAAYDTVWHRGLHLKLLRTIPDRHMVKFIMEMLSNRSFILRTSDGQRSRLRRLRNGVPQGSVLSPLLFNIYIHDLPETTSRQYGYADDLAIMLRRTTWSAVEQGLNQDMSILAAYLRKWRLQLSTGKTVSAAYHLCNGEAKRELSVSVDNKRLEHQLAPKYLGVRLDRTLSYKRHLEEVRAKVTARVSLIRRLAGTTWGASARTLRISTQALVFSAAEYCAPVWSRSPHVKKPKKSGGRENGNARTADEDLQLIDGGSDTEPAAAESPTKDQRSWLDSSYYSLDGRVSGPSSPQVGNGAGRSYARGLCPTCQEVWAKARHPNSLTSDRWVLKKRWSPRGLESKMERSKRISVKQIQGRRRSVVYGVTPGRSTCSRAHPFLPRNLRLCTKASARRGMKRKRNRPLAFKKKARGDPCQDHAQQQQSLPTVNSGHDDPQSPFREHPDAGVAQSTPDSGNGDSDGEARGPARITLEVVPSLVTMEPTVKRVAAPEAARPAQRDSFRDLLSQLRGQRSWGIVKEDRQ
ncbi:hypothetical protein NHX12_003924 [Muraenolepis orangiensis]|uniref:Reverse transcriptase domain-containing protein n=1 Tax=Muraenolepis orangiensis TaxID=630683 RepID=A0A9Q0DY18_9TELE|nr:hypothetical protein NHX12_003924 [Muraenolepis orangiensis]